MSGEGDFDFLQGRWTVVHRRLRERGAGSTNWEQFEGMAENRSLLGGFANLEEHFVQGQGFGGLALRTFSRASGLWSIYWVSERDGELGPPVAGRFSGDLGCFEGTDLDGARPVRVRFTWQRFDPSLARWSQSFSYDEGHQWETNWVMDFNRVAGPLLRP